MIKNKKELKEFLLADMINLGRKGKPKFFGDEVWKYEIILRKYEYFLNTKKKLRCYIYHYIHHKLCIKYSVYIPVNVFDKGLSIAHLGCIYVNHSAKIGENCRIHEMVTIGATGGENAAATIQNNVFIGSGAKIIGKITIADNVVVGANAVICKNIVESHSTWAGVPAKKISSNDSKKFILAIK